MEHNPYEVREIGRYIIRAALAWANESIRHEWVDVSTHGMPADMMREACIRCGKTREVPRAIAT
jgi:hypothetical protein